MAIRLYMDEHVFRPVSITLRLRGVDLIMLHEDHGLGNTDAWILDRATELGRPVFTMDYDFLIEAQLRQNRGKSFAGIIYVH